MSSPNFFLLCFTILKVLHSGFLTSTKQRLTLYSNALSWNDANTVCEQNNGSLLKISTTTKQYFVEHYLQDDWAAAVAGNIWTGLHEIDSLDGSKVKWSDCGDVTYSNYQTAPSPVVDSNKCFSVNPTTGQWKSERCDLKLSFICEENLGLCDFSRYPGTGCGVSLKQSAEYSVYDCLAACRNIPIQSGNEECWGVGHFLGYSGDDCWMFLSVDPEACAKNYYSSPAIDMYIKKCFTQAINSTVIADNSTLETPYSPCLVQYTTTESELSSVPSEPTTQTSVPLSSDSFTTPSITVLPTSVQSQETYVTDDTTSMATVNMSNGCTCPCRTNYSLSVEELLAQIKQGLVVNKRETSAFRRTLACANDKRPSAMMIGVGGIVFIALEMGFLILLDTPNLIEMFWFLQRRGCKRCRKWNKKSI